MRAAPALPQRVLAWTGSAAAAGRLGRYLLSPSVFGIAISGGLLLILAERVLLFSGGSNDDSEQLLYSQSFQFGYGLRNPPFYTWLVIGFTHLFGASLAAVIALKFLLLAGSYFGLLRVAKMIAADDAWATAAAATPLGMYAVAWDATLNYSNSVLLIFVCLMTLICLLQIGRTGRLVWYAALGLSMGVGCLTKYNYLVFCGAMFVAAMFDRCYRTRLRDWRIAALGLSLLVVLPYALFAHRHLTSLSVQFGAAPIVGEARPLPAAAAMSLQQTGDFGFDFLSPILFLLLVFFPAAWRPQRIDQPAALRLISRLLVTELLVFLLYFFFAYATGFGTSAIHHHLFFVFILAPAWFVARASWIDRARPALPVFAAALAALAMLVPAALAVKSAAGPVLERRPYLNIPYPALAEALKAAGFTEGTIFTWDLPYPLSGNLRPYFPDSRVVSAKFMFYQPPPRTRPGQCLAVWLDYNGVADRAVARAFEVMSGSAVGWDPQPKTIQLPMQPAWGTAVRFKYQMFGDGFGTCH